MKVFASDGSVLMEVKSLGRGEGNNIEFTGVVMGAMPVKGVLSPEEARKAFGLIKGKGLWCFLLSFIFRKNAKS